MLSSYFHLIQIKEIKNVTCNADETKNTDYNKVFVELSTEERAAQIAHEFWNPAREDPVMDFAKSICRFDQLIDGKQYQDSLKTRRTAEKHLRRIRADDSSNDMEREAEEYSSQQLRPRRRKKRNKSAYKKWQELSITESVIDNINKHRMIEEQTRKNVYEIICFAIRNKKDETLFLLGEWITENLQYSGKRTIILIHT